MAAFMITLECGHEVEWQEAPGDGGAPVVDLPIYCHICGNDQEIVECNPEQYVIETLTLSDQEPQQSHSPYGGWTAGEKVTIFYDTSSGSYGYCFSGVGDTGLYSESDDVTGFASSEAAKAAVRSR